MLYTRRNVFKNNLTQLSYREYNNLTRVFCAQPIEDMFPHNHGISGPTTDGDG